MQTTTNKLNNSMKKIIGLLLLLLTLLTACNKGKECGSWPNDLGDFQLLPTSREVFPYDEGIKAVVFTDSTGRAYEYQIENNRSLQIPFTFNSTCTVNPEYYPLYSLTEEYRRVAFYIGNEGFRIEQYVKVNREFADRLQLADFISVGFYHKSEAFLDWKGELQILVNMRDDPEAETQATAFHQELQLNGQTFREVYEQVEDDPDSSRRYYFNLEFGLVGFTDDKGEQIFSFDHVVY